jgi:hypothetical protein
MTIQVTGTAINIATIKGGNSPDSVMTSHVVVFDWQTIEV